MAVAALFAGTAPAAQAQSVQELKTQIEALQRKLEDLERKQQAAEAENKRKMAELEQKAPAQAVTGGDIPGSFKLPGTDTSIRIGGYVKLDGLYSSKGVGGVGDQLFAPATIPVGPASGAAEEHFEFHARQTRLNIFTHTPTSVGAVTALLEGDFFGANGNQVVSNSHGFRLRHAFGTIGKFGAGQFWSNFMDLNAIPDTLDFGGPGSQIFDRQAQVRWTEKFSGGEWIVSLENPESVIGSTTATSVAKPDTDQVPDIVGRVQWDVGKAKLSLAGMLRNVRIETATVDDDKWGGQVSFAGRVPVLGQDDLRFQVHAGNAAGRYQNGFYVDGVLGPTGQLLSLPKVFSAFAAYRHLWTQNLRSNLVLSGSRADLPDGAFGGLNKSVRSAHVNLIWSPAKKTDVGVEYIYGRRETENGQSGSLNRVQFSTQVSF
ncbi:MAG: DcaP family trimeric outer membrane transporter [Burkholderiales bacterium]|nr:DcaP family trimeric outer membrane transporter [Burkholderiales bacterium]